MDSHDAASSAYCLLRYPVKEYRDTITGEADYSACDSAYYELWRYMESLRDKRDTVYLDSNTNFMYRDVYRTRSKIVTQTITVVKKDSADITQYIEQINALQKQLALTQEVANAKITKILGIALATIATMAYQIRRLLRKTKQ